MFDVDESRIPTPDPNEGVGRFDPADYDVYKNSRVLPDDEPHEADKESEATWRNGGE